MATIFELRCLVPDENPASPRKCVYPLTLKSNENISHIRDKLQASSRLLHGQIAGYINVYKLNKYLDTATFSYLEPNAQNATSYGGLGITELTGMDDIGDHFQETLSPEDARKIHLIATLHSLYFFPWGIAITDTTPSSTVSQFLEQGWHFSGSSKNLWIARSK